MRTRGIVYLLPLIVIAVAVVTIGVVVNRVNDASQQAERVAAGEKVGGCGDPNQCRDWEAWDGGCCRVKVGHGCSANSDCASGLSCTGGVCSSGGVSDVPQGSDSSDLAGGCGDAGQCRAWEQYVDGCCRAITGSGCGQSSDCLPGVSCLSGVCGGGGTQACGGPTWQCQNQGLEKCINGSTYSCGNDGCYYQSTQGCGDEGQSSEETEPAEQLVVKCVGGTPVNTCSTKIGGMYCNKVPGETRPYFSSNPECGDLEECGDGTRISSCNSVGERCVVTDYNIPVFSLKSDKYCPVADVGSNIGGQVGVVENDTEEEIPKAASGSTDNGDTGAVGLSPGNILTPGAKCPAGLNYNGWCVSEGLTCSSAGILVASGCVPCSPGSGLGSCINETQLCAKNNSVVADRNCGNAFLPASDAPGRCTGGVEVGQCSFDDRLCVKLSYADGGFVAELRSGAEADSVCGGGEQLDLEQRTAKSHKCFDMGQEIGLGSCAPNGGLCKLVGTAPYIRAEIQPDSDCTVSTEGDGEQFLPIPNRVYLPSSEGVEAPVVVTEEQLGLAQRVFENPVVKGVFGFFGDLFRPIFLLSP